MSQLSRPLAGDSAGLENEISGRLQEDLQRLVSPSTQADGLFHADVASETKSSNDSRSEIQKGNKSIYCQVCSVSKDANFPTDNDGTTSSSSGSSSDEDSSTDSDDTDSSDSSNSDSDSSSDSDSDASTASACSERTKVIAKYTCPGCGIRYCSLACNKKHKEEAGCTGKKDPAAYVPLHQFTTQHLKQDFRFLEELYRTTESSKRFITQFGTMLQQQRRPVDDSRNKSKGRHGHSERGKVKYETVTTLVRLSQKQSLFLRAARAEEVNLRLMPKGMERSSRNTSEFKVNRAALRRQRLAQRTKASQETQGPSETKELPASRVDTEQVDSQGEDNGGSEHENAGFSEGESVPEEAIKDKQATGQPEESDVPSKRARGYSDGVGDSKEDAQGSLSPESAPSDTTTLEEKATAGDLKVDNRTKEGVKRDTGTGLQEQSGRGMQETSGQRLPPGELLWRVEIAFPHLSGRSTKADSTTSSTTASTTASKSPIKTTGGSGETESNTVHNPASLTSESSSDQDSFVQIRQASSNTTFAALLKRYLAPASAFTTQSIDMHAQLRSATQAYYPLVALQWEKARAYVEKLAAAGIITPAASDDDASTQQMKETSTPDSPRLVGEENVVTLGLALVLAGLRLYFQHPNAVAGVYKYHHIPWFTALSSDTPTTTQASNEKAPFDDQPNTAIDVNGSSDGKEPTLPASTTETFGTYQLTRIRGALRQKTVIEFPNFALALPLPSQSPLPDFDDPIAWLRAVVEKDQNPPEDSEFPLYTVTSQEAPRAAVDPALAVKISEFQKRQRSQSDASAKPSYEDDSSSTAKPTSRSHTNAMSTKHTSHSSAYAHNSSGINSRPSQHNRNSHTTPNSHGNARTAGSNTNTHPMYPVPYPSLPSAPTGYPSHSGGMPHPMPGYPFPMVPFPAFPGFPGHNGMGGVSQFQPPPPGTYVPGFPMPPYPHIYGAYPMGSGAPHAPHPHYPFPPYPSHQSMTPSSQSASPYSRPMPPK